MSDSSFCSRFKSALPDCPVIGACHSGDMVKLARFLGQGMRAYVLRDQGQDFVFLLQVTVESVVQAVQAERERKIAEKLREEVESVRKLQESIIPRDMKVPDGLPDLPVRAIAASRAGRPAGGHGRR